MGSQEEIDIDMHNTSLTNSSIYMYIHTYIHTLHTYIRTYIHTHTYIHTSFIHTYIHTHTHTHTHTYTHIHTYVHTHIHTYIHTYIHTQRCTNLGRRVVGTLNFVWRRLTFWALSTEHASCHPLGALNLDFTTYIFGKFVYLYICV